MDLQWMAAILAPRDVAPHPNFFSDDIEDARAASCLALVIQGRVGDLERINSAGRSERFGQEWKLVETAQRSLNIETLPEALPEMTELAIGYLKSDMAIAAAAAILASVSLAENDDINQALQLLRTVDESLASRGEESSSLFVRAAILQQIALRTSESGDDGNQYARKALVCLRGVSINDIPTFPTSKGVAWRSAGTIRRIMEDLKRSAASLVSGAAGYADRAWVPLVKSAAPELASEAVRGGHTGYAALVNDIFESKSLTNSMTWRAEDPVDAPVWRALLHFELTGNRGAAREWRTQLGKLRLIREHENDRPEMKADALQLLRHSEDLKSLTAALRRIQANGPLEALTRDIAKVQKRTVHKKTIRDAELIALRYGAQLMSAHDAARLIDSLTPLLDEPGSYEMRPGWVHPGIRAERLLDALVALAPVAGWEDRVADAILYSGRRAPEQDEILIRAYSRAVRALEWASISEEAKDRWREWLAGSAASLLVRALSDELAGPLALVEPGKAAKDIELDQVALELNSVILGYKPAMRTEYISAGAKLVLEGLEAVQRNAQSGVYAMGVHSVADIAVGLITHGALSELWPMVGKFLTNPIVARADKSPALERLARTTVDIPVKTRQLLSNSIRDLLEQPDRQSPTEDSVVPYPEGLRTAANLGLLPNNDLFAYVSRMASGPGLRSRVEAARTLVPVLSVNESDNSWAIALALHLSRDPDADVRASAGRAIVAALHNADDHLAPLLEDRLKDMLTEDGILVPLLILRSLSEMPMTIPGTFASVLDNLASTHPAHGVRLQATAAVRALSD